MHHIINWHIISAQWTITFSSSFFFLRKGKWCASWRLVIELESFFFFSFYPAFTRGNKLPPLERSKCYLILDALVYGTFIFSSSITRLLQYIFFSYLFPISFLRDMNSEPANLRTIYPINQLIIGLLMLPGNRQSSGQETDERLSDSAHPIQFVWCVQ